MSARIYEPDVLPFVAEPKDYERFYPSVIETEIKEILDESLADYEFDTTTYNAKTEELIKILRENVKNVLNMPRYKFVVQVVMGRLEGQGVKVTSKCLWNTSTDNFASYTYRNEDFYCTAMVFGLYNE